MGWAQQRARDVMTSPVKSIELGATLDEVVQRLADEGVTGLLVVDRNNRPVGVVSHADVVGYVAGLERGLSGAGSFYFQSEPRADRVSSGPPVNLESVDDDALRAAEVDAVMTPEVIWVPDGARLPEVARTMVERGIHRVLVEKAGTVVGIVSTLDVLRALMSEAAPRRATKKKAPRGAAKKKPARKAAARAS
ncbi:MAG: CBS domain-containing protein [Planctomycetes bacterium]|nr:CBS domain-containing protein [Planctomycetota bacterium]